MSLMGDVIHQVNHPPTCTSIYHSQEGILLAGLLICGIWHIAGYVTKLIAKFQNPQVANSSPEIASITYAANVATHALSLMMSS